MSSSSHGWHSASGLDASHRTNARMPCGLDENHLPVWVKGTLLMILADSESTRGGHRKTVLVGCAVDLSDSGVQSAEDQLLYGLLWRDWNTMSVDGPTCIVAGAACKSQTGPYRTCQQDWVEWNMKLGRKKSYLHAKCACGGLLTYISYERLSFWMLDRISDKKLKRSSFRWFKVKMTLEDLYSSCTEMLLKL